MPRSRLVHTLALGLLVALAADARAQAPEPNDYSEPETWLCLPGHAGACDVDLTTAVIAPNGTLSIETWTRHLTAPVDCFYAYPTVSTHPEPYSDMTPTEAERNVIRQQLARFESQCRIFAPMYRQVTLAGLTARIAQGQTGESLQEGLQYDDVRDAWRHYMEHHNDGRGVVLIGHSQGAFILTELIRQEIEGRPVQDQLVSALLIGMTLPVARPGRSGGSFQDVPLCESDTQTGCVISFATFRATAPPPENTLFGAVDDPDLVAACVNPAELDGSGELRHYLATEGRSILVGGPGAAAAGPQWLRSGVEITAPWVRLPGLLTAECAENEHAAYLEVEIHGDPEGPRAADVYGDLTPQWGLHLVDMNLAMGNLVDIVGTQARSWQEARGR